MGTIRKGANGGFSGKAGSVVGSSRREVDYIRGMPKLSGKPATMRQLEQRDIASLLPTLAQVCSLRHVR